MEESVRQKVCQLVAGIVITDEDLDPLEEAFVERMLAKFELDPNQRDVIFPLVDGEEAARAMRELPEDVQREAFTLLIQAAVADRKIVPEEQAYLATVAKAIGVSTDELDRRLVEALEGS